MSGDNIKEFGILSEEDLKSEKLSQMIESIDEKLFDFDVEDIAFAYTESRSSTRH